MKKQLLILLGPQGSGNHIFARIFSMHKDVFGWKSLTQTYYQKHNSEPFAEYFTYPQLLTEDVFSTHDYFVANVSVPFGFQGLLRYPKIIEVANIAKGFGIDVQFGILTRDEEILSVQEARTRKELSFVKAKQYVEEVLMPSEFPINFISLESFFSYKLTYLQYLSKLLKFPIVTDDRALAFITDSPNKKYITPIDAHWLDAQENQPISIDKLDTLPPGVVVNNYVEKLNRSQK